jgi:hypothetical protein
MEIIKIILNSSGQLETILSEGETNIEVLQRGKDDTKIDEFESILDVVEI